MNKSTESDIKKGGKNLNKGKFDSNKVLTISMLIWLLNL